MDAKGYLVEGIEATRNFWSSDWLIDHTSLKPLLFPDARVYGKSIYPRSENCTRDTLRSLEKHYYKVWSFLFMCSLSWWVNFSYYMHLYTLKHFQDPPPWAAKTGWPLHFMDLWWMECHKLKFCGVTYGMLESWWRLGIQQVFIKAVGCWRNYMMVVGCSKIMKGCCNLQTWHLFNLNLEVANRCQLR